MIFREWCLCAASHDPFRPFGQLPLPGGTFLWTPSVASRQLPLQGGAVSTGYGWRWKQAPVRVTASRLSASGLPPSLEKGRGAGGGLFLRASGADVREADVGGWRRPFWAESTGAPSGAPLPDKRPHTHHVGADHCVRPIRPAGSRPAHSGGAMAPSCTGKSAIISCDMIRHPPDSFNLSRHMWPRAHSRARSASPASRHSG